MQTQPSPPRPAAAAPGRPAATTGRPAAATPGRPAALPHTQPDPQAPDGQGPTVWGGGSPPAARPPQDEELLGQVLGSYRLVALVGKGGMGRVYLAEHVKLGRKVALKLLRPEYSVRRDAVARFFKEARAVNTIRHHNIVDVTDFVELPDGRTFIIMELLEGSNLGELVRREGPLPVHRALGILLQVCEALAAAHREGIIHRDLKPDNIFVEHGDCVKLLDFGVAKLLYPSALDGEASVHTLEGSVVGTPAYMSPEQAGGTSVDHRSDIYSLGAIMYELFTGQRVFEARSFGEFVLKHLNAIPIPPREVQGCAALPHGLEAVILRCLEKRPEQRYPDVMALRGDLVKVLGGEATAALSLPPGAAAGRTSRTVLLAGAAFAGMVLAGAAAWLLLPVAGAPAAAPPGAGPPAAIPAPAEPGGPAAATPADLEFTFRSAPPGAQVFVAGEPAPLGTTPLTRVRPAADREREFIFRLDGYQERRARASGTAAPEVFAVLERVEPPPRAGGVRGRPRHPAAPEGPPAAAPAAPAPPAAAPATPPAPETPPKKKIDKVDTVDPFAP